MSECVCICNSLLVHARLVQLEKRIRERGRKTDAAREQEGASERERKREGETER